MAAPALAASIADCAICAGVTGTAGFLPGVSAEPVTAQAIMTLRCMCPPRKYVSYAGNLARFRRGGIRGRSRLHVAQTSLGCRIRGFAAERLRNAEIAAKCRRFDSCQYFEPGGALGCSSLQVGVQAPAGGREPRRLGGFAGALSISQQRRRRQEPTGAARILISTSVRRTPSVQVKD